MVTGEYVSREQRSSDVAKVRRAVDVRPAGRDEYVFCQLDSTEGKRRQDLLIPTAGGGEMMQFNFGSSLA